MGKIALLFILLVRYLKVTENVLSYGELRSYNYNHFNVKIKHRLKIFVNHHEIKLCGGILSFGISTLHNCVLQL